jgi:Lipocalin-like domain
MKKSIILLALVFALFSCKSTSPVNTNLDKKSEVKMKGNWVIKSITYPGSEYIKVSSFDLADSKCFVGSSWKLVSNNNTGIMSLNSTDCTSFTSNIKWYVNRNNEFVMKILDNTKAKKQKEGYALTVANQTETSFQLVDKMDVGGKMTEIVYQFEKAN